jgi:CheY-like chemotaxis protein
MVKTIVIVDDESSVCYTVKHGLESLDPEINVVSISSGAECLEWLQQHEIPDLILLDIMMPEMSGWETFDKIQENLSWKSIPVVFLTARTDRIAKNAGSFLAADYVEKPFKIPELKQRIDKVLQAK